MLNRAEEADEEPDATDDEAAGGNGENGDNDLEVDTDLDFDEGEPGEEDLEEIEEERRLFYGACSRAKQDLLITMPSYVTTYNAFLSYPSRFLVEISRDKFHYQ